MKKIVSYDGFAPEIETWDYVYPAYPTLVEEIKALLPPGAEWSPEPTEETDTNEEEYYGVKYGNHFMWVLYDDEVYVEYDPVREPEWTKIVETVLTKMNEISMAVFQAPAVHEDEDF